MNEDIQNFLNSYSGSIDLYKDKVAPDNEKLNATIDYLAEMKTLGASCADMSEFMTKVMEKDMMNIMSQHLTELALEGLAQDRASGSLKIPLATDLGMAYREAFKSIENKDQLPKTCAIYERVFQLEEESEHAPEFLRKLVEEDLLVKMASVNLAEVSRNIIKESEDMSQPCMAFHNEQMALMADKARTAIEMEYESQRLMELNRIELMCDQMLCADLYYRLGSAIASYLFSDSEENRKRVVANYMFAAEFFGVDMDMLYAIPRVVDLIEKVIIPPLNTERQVYTLESFIAEQKATIQKCMKSGTAVQGPASRTCAVLWGKTIHLDHVLDTFRTPDRPKDFLS